MDSPQADGSSRESFAWSVSCSSSVPSTFSPWECLTDDLVAKILALLPLSSVYLARGVCKRWQDIIWSPVFYSFLNAKRLRMPLFLEFQQHMYNQAWAYDLEGSHWFHLNFSFVPETALILAASYGLVCLGRMTEEGFVMYVCNPLTKAFRKLPTIDQKPDVVILDVDRQLHSYKIIGLVMPNRFPRGQMGAVLVYNRMTDRWRETARVPEGLWAENLWDVTVSGGMLYCLSNQQRMVVYDIEQGFWNHIPYPHAPLARILHTHVLEWRQDAHLLERQQDAHVLEHSYLCDRKGRLVLITHRQKLRNVFITKFDPVSRTWRSSHVSAATGSIFCVGRLSSLSFSMPQAPGHVFLLRPEGIELYDSTLKSFQLLPKSPITRCKLHREDIFMKGLWFEPRLDAKV